MSEVTDIPVQEMTQDQENFKAALMEFRAMTQLSATKTAALFDLAPATVNRWWKRNPVNGQLRLPHDYVQHAIAYKLEILNRANREGGLFASLRGLKPDERVAKLQQELDSATDS